MSTIKGILISIATAVFLYATAVFVSLEPDVREWSWYGRAILVFLWITLSVTVVGFIDSFERINDKS